MSIMSCAPDRIRTCDTRFRRAVLYPLSYEGICSQLKTTGKPAQGKHQGTRRK